MGGCCKRAINAIHISNSITNKSCQQDIQDEESKKLELVTFDEQFNRDYSLVYNEIICQICHERMNKPMTLPCLTHSICLICAENLWKGWLNSGMILICPTCGERGGTRKIESKDFLKLNSELDNIIHAYDKEREKWFLERRQLEDLIAYYEKDRKAFEGISIYGLRIKLNKLNKKHLVEFCSKIIQNHSSSPSEFERNLINPLELLDQILANIALKKKKITPKNGR